MIVSLSTSSKYAVSSYLLDTFPYLLISSYLLDIFPVVGSSVQVGVKTARKAMCRTFDYQM